MFERTKTKGVSDLIDIENPNRVQQKSKKVKDVDVDAKVELSRRERYVYIIVVIALLYNVQCTFGCFKHVSLPIASILNLQCMCHVRTIYFYKINTCISKTPFCGLYISSSKQFFCIEINFYGLNFRVLLKFTTALDFEKEKGYAVYIHVVYI